MLNNIPQHSAQWYYYSSIANQGLGNNAAALEQAKKATEMEPQNAEYAGWRQRMEPAAAGIPDDRRSMVECRYPAAADFAGSCVWQT